MIHFVGAGPGAPDLITVRGQRLLQEADQVIYAGSLVNPELLKLTKEGCRIYNSAVMTLEEVLFQMQEGEEKGWMTVRLHTGDPSLYGAVREQMDRLDELGISYDSCPGVSLRLAVRPRRWNLEYTLPDVSQSVVITRMEGRNPCAGKGKSTLLCRASVHYGVFLSAGLLKELEAERSGRRICSGNSGSHRL